MDRARAVGGLVWVGAGMVFEIAWVASGGRVPGPVIVVLLACVSLLAILTLLRPLSRAAWLTGWVTCVLLAAELAGAVADRFGVLGGPGSPGVSWGSWDAFVRYTALLLPGPGGDVAAAAATLATGTEILLVPLLLSGWQRRWVGKALAGLFTVYVVAMGLSVGPGELAAYGMPVLVGGALLVSASPTRRPHPADAMGAPGGPATAGAPTAR